MKLKMLTLGILAVAAVLMTTAARLRRALPPALQSLRRAAMCSEIMRAMLRCLLKITPTAR